MNKKTTYDNSDISLLYPEEKINDPCNTASLSLSAEEQLEITELIELRSSDLASFFTNDPDVIRYRQETFRDITEIPELKTILKKMTPILTDITELRQLESENEISTYGYLYSMTEAELYLSLMDVLKEDLLPLSDRIKSRAFKSLVKRISELCESEYYSEVNKKLGELTHRVRDIKSITLGVNLNDQLKCESAGVISVNNERFKSGDIIEKIKHLDFKKDDYTCIAKLIPYSKDQDEDKKTAMTHAVQNAITDVFKSSIKDWKRSTQAYVLANSDFLIRLMPEVEFVMRASELIDKLNDRGCDLVFPEIDETENDYFVKGLINPVVALKTKDEMVPNDFTFDKDGMIYILTGPNRGGKSVITCAVGLSFIMAQLGLPVTAESARLCPCDAIFPHFPQGGEDTIEKGRLGEECSRISKIFDSVTSKSLVLLDEAFSSTGSYEGSIIAMQVVEALCLAGARTIFSTHLHGLASAVPEINEKFGKDGVKVDNLVAEIEQDGIRNFKIIRKTPDGKSYASDIANKYGLSFDTIKEKIKRNKNQ